MLTRTNLAHLPGYLLFFLMLFVPTAYQPIKIALIVLILGIILVDAGFAGRLALHRSVLLITLAMSFTGFVFVSIGLLNGNPGPLRVIAVYVLWPLLYMLFVAGCSSEAVLRGLMKVLVVGAISVSVYSLLYILSSAKLIPGFLYYELDQGQNIGFYGGHIQYAMYSISSLLFLVPFLLAALVLWPEELDPPVARRWLWAAVVASILPVILSERKVMWLLVLSAPLLAMAVRLALPLESQLATRKICRQALIGMAVGSVCLLLFLRFVLNFDFSVLLNMLSEAANVSGGQSDDIIGRKMQYYALMDEWAHNPLFGVGHGGVATVIRNPDQPWTYELSYVALLYHTGIIGMLVYGAGIAWTYVQSILLLHRDRRLGLILGPVLVGTTCFLIGNASNPYLEKYDYLWALFLPIAILNLWLLQSRLLPKEAAVNAAA